jgi:hypothetical protein
VNILEFNKKIIIQPSLPSDQQRRFHKQSTTSQQAVEQGCRSEQQVEQAMEPKQKHVRLS